METSEEMINALIEHIEAGSYVLEPSAGDGLIVKYLVELGCRVDAVELNNAKFIKLSNEYNSNRVTIYKEDFLFYKADRLYDYVIAVPPYKDNVDCEHIIKMYNHCRTGGKVISFTLPTWVTGMYTNQRAFRKWLSTKNYTLKLFENDKSYLECPKMLLIIQK